EGGGSCAPHAREQVAARAERRSAPFHEGAPMSERPVKVPDDPRVAMIDVGPRYPSSLEDANSAVAEGLQAVSDLLGWSAEGRGAFGAAIPRGARVLVKPNWVLHENHGPWGVEPLITHPSLVRAVVDAALRTDAARVVVGDAPVQGCDFDAL